MALGETELVALRTWLVFLTLFELPNFWQYLVSPTGRLDGFFSTLHNGRAEKRAWSIVLALLCLARIHAVVYHQSEGALAHNAAVHVLEAVTFGYEFLVKRSNGNWTVFSVILANAFWFTSAALRV